MPKKTKFGEATPTRTITKTTNNSLAKVDPVKKESAVLGKKPLQSSFKKDGSLKKVTPYLANLTSGESLNKVESKVDKLIRERKEKKQALGVPETQNMISPTSRKMNMINLLKSISNHKDPVSSLKEIPSLQTQNTLVRKSKRVLTESPLSGLSKLSALDNIKKEVNRLKDGRLKLNLTGVGSSTSRVPGSKFEYNIKMKESEKAPPPTLVREIEKEEVLKEILDHGDEPIDLPTGSKSNLLQIEDPTESKLAGRSLSRKKLVRTKEKRSLAESKTKSHKTMSLSNSNDILVEVEKIRIQKKKSLEAIEEKTFMYFMDFIKFGGKNGEHKESQYVEHICSSFTMFKQLGPLISSCFHQPRKIREVYVPGDRSDKLLILFDIDETLVHCDIKGTTKSYETRTRIQISDAIGRKMLVGPSLR